MGLFKKKEKVFQQDLSNAEENQGTVACNIFAYGADV